ncbi:MAG TPA: hypothetical protein VG651_14170 [Stellaceae bacterium]|nr:hypothetical protein [Stellaceae bacterium]
MTRNGALSAADDADGTIRRIAYTGKGKPARGNAAPPAPSRLPQTLMVEAL